MKDNQLIILGLCWLVIMIPLAICATNKKHSGAIVLIGIIFSPLIGWLAYLLLPDKPKAIDTTKADKLKRKLQGLHSEDPLEAWERQQRSQSEDQR
jgi:hypothetical protein